MDRISRIAPGDRISGPATPGMSREQAVATEGLWAGLVTTEPGMVSGWHHHGEQQTAVYVLAGALRMESGGDGSEVVDAGPGDFVYVPAGAVHRESNPSQGPSQIIVIRAGAGESVVNVDGPEG
ncbi:MAG TPA: cupin domain-containing protein [Actinomycetota bacterium]|nr:cupin domain-containing protein [Actinomycetota bacterium]